MTETVVHVNSQEQYDDLMEKLKKYKTYYVTQEQLDLIDELQSKTFPIDFLILNSDGYFKPLTVKLTSEEAKALLRYLGGDKTIEFKVKEQLYRLSRLDKYGDTVYFTKKWGIGNPVVSSKNYAFTAPLDEIKKWQTPAWEIEKAE